MKKYGIALIIIAAVLIGGGIFLLRSGGEISIETIMRQEKDSETGEAKEVFVTNGIKHSIPLEEFKVGIGGGDSKQAILGDRLPKDVITPIDNPKFISVAEANEWLEEEDPGVGFSRGNIHRFYPYQILVRHEIVNDTVEGQRILITYCPLCLTGFVLDPLVQGERVEFGTSGLLWNSNLVMYDRKTNSLWPQVLAEAVVGSATGQKIDILPSDQVRFGNWKATYPDGEVLSRDTGFLFGSYGSNPYGDSYLDLPATSLQFTQPDDTRLPFGAFVFGIVVDGKAKAYYVEAVKEKGEVVDSFQGETYRLRYDEELDVVRMYRKLASGSEERVNPVSGFWFSWSEAHPDTELYK